MAKNALDPRELLIGGMVFVVGSLTSLGIIGPEVLSIDFSQILVEFGNVGVSLGRAASIAALGFVYVNRDVGFFEFNGHDLWIVYATAALILAPPLLPAFEETIAEMPAAIIAFAVQTTGFTIITYQN